MEISALVGTNLRKARQAKGWSQDELSFQSGVDRSYLSEVESGMKNVGIKRLDALARALEVDVATFFKGWK